MTDMVERAARAVLRLWDQSNPRANPEWATDEARAALLAALDPEAMTDDEVHFICMSVRAAMPTAGAYGAGLTAEEVRAVLGSFKEMTQGEL